MVLWVKEFAVWAWRPDFQTQKHVWETKKPNAVAWFETAVPCAEKVGQHKSLREALTPATLVCEGVNDRKEALSQTRWKLTANAQVVFWPPHPCYSMYRTYTTALVHITLYIQQCTQTHIIHTSFKKRQTSITAHVTCFLCTRSRISWVSNQRCDIYCDCFALNVTVSFCMHASQEWQQSHTTLPVLPSTVLREFSLISIQW